jgi:hypothetical protein
MTEQTLLRYTPTLGKLIDKWRHAQLDTPTRADAMRRLVAQALKDAGLVVSDADVSENEPPTKPTKRGRKA